MSTARSIWARFYLQKAIGHALAALLLVAVPAGCKKKPIAEDPDEQGKLSRIATRLEEGFAGKPLPSLSEPDKLVDRLGMWDDFRACTVRAYVSKKRVADRLAREGLPRVGRHSSIGEAAVEECAVQSAIVNKDPRMCERLELDFKGPSGEMPTSALRCWDTRARVLGRADECPVVWLPDDQLGRNPECLAAARRDGSFCAFADDPFRCRAILSGDPAGCGNPNAAPDCRAATTYWSNTIPAGEGPPALDLTPGPDGKKPVSAQVTVRWPRGEHPTIRIEGPHTSHFVSWPGGRAATVAGGSTKQFWGAEVPPDAAQVTWRAGAPAVKIAFRPGGMGSGLRPVQPASATMAATVLLVWPDPRQFKRCSPGPATTGQVEYDAGSIRVGGFVTGRVATKGLACTDGTTVDVSGEFRLAIIDIR